MKFVQVACGVLALVIAVLVPGCPRRDCANDSDCPEYAYCDQQLGYCFTPSTDVADSSVEFDAGSTDAATAEDGGQDAGPSVQGRFCASSGWCWDNPSPSGRTHLSIHGSSETDVWAVGRRSIIRFNGAVWIDYPTDPDDLLTGVWVESSSSAWAVGFAGLIKRWDGANWSTVASPTAADLIDIYGLSPSQVWAVGANGTILRWDGSEWTIEDSPASADINSIWGTGPNNLWAVGSGGLILRRTASGWSTVLSPTSSTLTGVCATGADIWAVGIQGELLWSDGSTWSLHQTASSALWGIGCRGASEAWAAGEGFVLRWDGEQWTEVPVAVRPGVGGIYLAPLPSRSGFAVGRFGQIFELSNNAWAPAHTDKIGADVSSIGGAGPERLLVGTKDGRILSCTEDRCDEAFRTDAGSISDLTGVETSQPWGIAGDRVLLGSAEGWTERKLGSPLTGIASRQIDTSNDEAWVVGNDRVQRCDRTQCDPSLNVDMPAPRDVVMDGSDAVVTNGFQLFRCNSSGCSEIQLSQSVSITALWSPAPGVVWAASFGGKLVRITGQTATVDQLPTTRDLLDLTGTSETDAWIGGASGLLLRRSGQNWAVVESGTLQPIKQVHALPSGAIVAGGDNSMLLRYEP